MLDDLLELRTGDQIPADGVVRTADGLEIDESLLTGESDPVDKTPGDEVLSGSFVVAGIGRVPGDDGRRRRRTPAKLAAEARRFTLVRSELDRRHQHDPALHHVRARSRSSALLALAPAPTTTTLDDGAHRHRSPASSAMVPEGLVLLTSIAFGVAAVTLARRKVLVQELPAVEGLARVDVVCLDKTGTLTEGDDRVRPARAARRRDDAEVERRARRARRRREPQRDARRARRRPSRRRGLGRAPASVPFSSARKWSARQLRRPRHRGCIGAPEMVLADGSTTPCVARRRRARGDGPAGPAPRPRRRAARRRGAPGRPAAGRARAVRRRRCAPTRPRPSRYFAEQGVALKVISGDNPRTVGGRRARASACPAPTDPFDARELPEDLDELADVLEDALGVRPGHAPAEAGDGRRAAVARPRRGDDRRRRERRARAEGRRHRRGDGLRRAATRAVAQLVLLDGKFSTMPGVVAEGRRVIANIERVGEPVRHQDRVRGAARDRRRASPAGRTRSCPATSRS